MVRAVPKDICLQRAIGGGIMAARVFTEWTCEGSLKDVICRVDADGNLNRYLQECMMVHDEWVIL